MRAPVVLALVLAGQTRPALAWVRGLLLLAGSSSPAPAQKWISSSHWMQDVRRFWANGDRPPSSTFFSPNLLFQ